MTWLSRGSRVTLREVAVKRRSSPPYRFSVLRGSASTTTAQSAKRERVTSSIRSTVRRTLSEPLSSRSRTRERSPVPAAAVEATEATEDVAVGVADDAGR